MDALELRLHIRLSFSAYSSIDRPSLEDGLVSAREEEEDNDDKRRRKISFENEDTEDDKLSQHREVVVVRVILLHRSCAPISSSSSLQCDRFKLYGGSVALFSVGRIFYYRTLNNTVLYMLIKRV